MKNRSPLVLITALLSAPLVAGEAHAQPPAQPADPADEPPPPPGEAAEPPTEPTDAPSDPEQAEASEPGDEEDTVEDEPIDVVVTGTRSRASRFDSPADVTVLGGDALSQPGHKSFREPLTTVGGVRANARGEHPTFSGLEMRGLSTNNTSGGNVLILLDGIPQRRLSFGGPYMGALPYDAVSRIEVVKGPLSAQYGRGSLAGAVQLFTHPGTAELGARTRFMHELVTNSLRGSLRLTGPLPVVEDTTWSLTGTGLASSGWQPRTEMTKGDVYLHVMSQPTLDDEIHLVAGVFSTAEEAVAPVLIDQTGERLPGIKRDANLAVPDHNRLDLTELRVGSSYSRYLSDHVELKITGAFWHADTHWLMGRPSDRPAAGGVVNRPARDLDWTEQSFLAEAQTVWRYELDEMLNGALTAGVSGELMSWESSVQPIAAEGATFSEGIPIDLGSLDETPRTQWTYGDWTTRETDETDWGVFLSDQTTFYDWVTVQGALRYDGYRRSQENLSTGNASTVTNTVYSPIVGGVVHLVGHGRAPLGLNLYGTWGRGFSPVYRAVSNTEIVELEPETSESVEGGVKVQGFAGKVEATVAGFQLARNDVVGWNPVAETQQNVGDWLIRGGELTVRGRPVEGLTLYGWGTWRQPTIDRDAANPDNEGNDLPFVARLMVAAGAAYRPAEGPGAGLQARFVDETYADDANTIELPAYVLLDADLSYHHGGLTVSVFGKNLLDWDYYSAVFMGVRQGSAFAGTPRTFGVEATVEY